jgi:hypothetical protein
MIFVLFMHVDKVDRVFNHLYRANAEATSLKLTRLIDAGTERCMPTCIHASQRLHLTSRIDTIDQTRPLSILLGSTWSSNPTCKSLRRSPAADSTASLRVTKDMFWLAFVRINEGARR